MNDLPFNEGIQNVFVADAEKVSATAWMPDVGSRSFVFDTASYDGEDNAIILSGDNIGYADIQEPGNWTMYAVMKISNIISSDSYLFGISLRAASNARTDIYIENSNKSLAYNINQDVVNLYRRLDEDYRIITVTRSGSAVKIYCDGEFITSVPNTETQRADKIQLKTGANNGSSPSKSGADKYTLYLKYFAFANVVHDYANIKRNSLFIHQSLFGEVSNSEKITKAFVLGYLLGFNIVSAKLIEEEQKAYREGLIDSGADDITEPITIPYPTVGDTEITFPTDDDPENDPFDDDDLGMNVTDPAIIDMSDTGWTINLTDDPTGSAETDFSITITVEPYAEETPNGNRYRNRLIATVRDADGNVIDTYFCGYMYMYQDFIDRTDTTTGAYYSNGNIYVETNYSDREGSGSQTTVIPVINNGGRYTVSSVTNT